MNKFSYFNFLWISLLCLSACVPIPEVVNLSPKVLGWVNLNGKPLAQAVVFTNQSQSNCQRRDKFAISGKDGGFEIAEASKVQALDISGTSQYSTWEVCIAYQDKVYLGLQDRHFNFVAKKLVLLCELAFPQNPGDPRRGIAPSYCRLIESTNV